jgi:hypothetical protein
MHKTFLLLLLHFILLNADPANDLAAKLNNIVTERQLRGLQLELTKSGVPIFSHNSGTKNSYN